MSRRPPHHALREIRSHFAHPATWAVMLAIAALLAILGPFGTGDSLRAVPRLAFWSAHVAVNYVIGYAVNRLLQGGPLQGVPHWMALAVANLCTGLAICAGVFVINWAALGYVPGRAEAAGFFGTVLVIALIVSGVMEMLARTLVAADPSGEDRDSTPPILDRLAFDKRGALVALSAEDHYVRVTTTAGEDLVLMRFGDAVKEVGATNGLQVHRAHWVAVAEIRAARREGERAVLTLSTGAEVPVSRANVPRIREAGLLPR
ncbi:LytTR family DNA-binding domain-containing protein [Anianabacter salinae]|uniref:LytTR family DNA-binding domain-containing protein n=1 Tax=Anianabacter salinae TaxID=2851023 RepID=UPI00225E260F|nr:LytTR family DNA-binding domain-containing protein [Anianabacter salinae]MBV0914001.1 LytTR family transcriptional regulator DNA-binding domain-containing protein [Anianabacter salinae]